MAAARAKLRPEEREALVAGLNEREAAVYRRLEHAPLSGAAQLGTALKATAAQIEPVLRSLEALGLVEKFPPSKRRPFGEIWRPTADRQETVGDWIEGGYASRGYADLAAIQRDYPSVTALSDFADGAEQARREAEAAEARDVQRRKDAEEIKAMKEKKAVDGDGA